jgi:hypothetical protein
MPPVPKPARKKREKIGRVRVESNPLEDTEQMCVVDWLRLHRVLFSATVPDRRICQRMGYSPGVPDLMIYDRPETVENGLVYVGAAIEMKRRKGGIVSAEQKIWIEGLAERGWKCKVALGADDAIQFLEECGY